MKIIKRHHGILPFLTSVILLRPPCQTLCSLWKGEFSFATRLLTTSDPGPFTLQCKPHYLSPPRRHTPFVVLRSLLSSYWLDRLCRQLVVTGRLGGHRCPLNWNQTLHYCFLNINYLKPQPAAAGAQCRAEKAKVEAWMHTNFFASYCFPLVPMCLSDAGVTEAVPVLSLASMMTNPAIYVEDHYTQGPLMLCPLATTRAAWRPVVKIAQPKFNIIQPRSDIVDNYWELINTQVEALAYGPAVSLYLARVANMQSLLELLAGCYYTAEVACKLQIPQCFA